MKKATLTITCIIDDSKLTPEEKAELQAGPPADWTAKALGLDEVREPGESYEIAYKCEDVPAEDQPSTP